MGLIRFRGHFPKGDGYARANRQKPSGIAAKEMIVRVHLAPTLGKTPLDANSVRWSRSNGSTSIS
jgi:hypothetical protein